MVIVLAVLLLLVGMFFLGWIPVSMKRSVTFVGGRGGAEASFTSCDGKIFRVLRFRESRSYSFCLSCRVQQGALEVSILDSHRVPVLTLDQNHTEGVFSARGGAAYFLLVRFRNASGTYQLDWS